MSRHAFTLVELLVAVAIIGILAAIAVPNFLEAQTRSKVARTASDLRTLAVALEAYAVDEGSYPLNAGGLGLPGALFNLLEPRAYLTALPRDVFRDGAPYHYLAGGKVTTAPDEKYGRYVVAGAGPDRRLETALTTTVLYDPTNGTVSRGDVVRTQKSDMVALVKP